MTRKAQFMSRKKANIQQCNNTCKSSSKCHKPPDGNRSNKNYSNHITNAVCFESTDTIDDHSWYKSNAVCFESTDTMDDHSWYQTNVCLWPQTIAIINSNVVMTLKNHPFYETEPTFLIDLNDHDSMHKFIVKKQFAIDAMKKFTHQTSGSWLSEVLFLQQQQHRLQQLQQFEQIVQHAHSPLRHSHT